MTAFALKGLATRKLRSLLTMLAIVLGVAMVSGTYVLTDTIEVAFDSIFTKSYDETDAVVTGTKQVEWSESGKTVVPEALVAKVRSLPEVESATGTLLDFSGDTDQAQLLDKQGKAIQNGNPTFGFGIDPDAERFNPFDLTAGRWANRDDEVVIDAETASKYGYAVGQRIGVAAQGPIERFRIVGIAKLGEVSTIGGATIGIFTVNTAQRLHRKDGFDTIAVAAKSGVSQKELLKALSASVPSSVEVRSAEAQAAKDKEGIDEFVKFIRYFLLAFGGISLFVGAFVIFNTLSITVAQRTRELATLRTLGASRRQVMRSVIVEGLAIGIVGSLVGLGAGVMLARGLSALFGALDLALPEADLVFRTRTAVVAILLGTLITLLASIVPALRATRIPPIAAVREGAAVGTGKLSRKVTVAALVVVTAAAASVSYGLLGSGIGTGPRILTIVAGTLGLFVGLAMLAPRLVQPLAAVVGRPSAAFGGAPGRLAHENAIRNPGRTAATAAALMIGLTLVTFVSVLARGMLASGDRAVRTQMKTEYALTSNTGWDSIPVGAAEAAARANGVTLVSSVRWDRAEVADGGGETDVGGIDRRTIADAYRFDWVEGSDATARSLGPNDALVRRTFAKKHETAIGDAVVLATPAGKRVEVTVRGIFDAPDIDSLLPAVVITQEKFDTSFERPADSFALVQADSAASVERAVRAFPAAGVETVESFSELRHGFLTQILNLLYVLLGLSVIVSLFGMVNTLVLAVFERTRELGMLRAVGMTRRQVRRMILHEGMITALIGAGIGLPLGIGLAALVVQSLGKYGVTFSLPVGTIAVFVIVAAVAGLGAAMFPARRASRLNVLEALQYE